MRRAVSYFGMLSLTLAAAAAAGDFVDATPDSAATSADAAAGIDVEIRNDPTGSSFRTRPQLLGDMGGFRTMLARHGMTLDIVSLDESFGFPDQALDTKEGNRYAGLTDLVLTVDTGAAGWWSGGLFVVDLQNTRGGDISDLVGDIQGISNIVAPPGTRFAEYFYKQNLKGGRFCFKIGKQDANADFVVSEGGGEFINSSFGLIPTVPLPTYPAAAFGVMGGWAATRFLRFKIGYWDGTPAADSGISTAVFDGAAATVGAAGVEISPFGGDILDGTYRIGYWRHSEVDVAVDSAKDSLGPITGPAEGVYFTADQGLWEGDDRALRLFAQGGWGEADRSAVSRYFGGGVTFSGPLKSRPEDMIGLGVAFAEIGRPERKLHSHPSETVIELFYRLPVAGWMFLNPDLQWIHRPGGVEETEFVAGLRVATSF